MKGKQSITASLATRLALCLTVFVFALLQGCSTSGGAGSVPRSSAGKLRSVDTGTVVSTREVVIDGEGTYLGQSSGAIVGSAVGQTAGQGSGRVIAAAGGAVAGGIIGNVIEKELSKKQAQELTISLDDGGTVVVIQEVRDAGFRDGDRVNVTHTRTGEALVSHSVYNTDGLY